MRTKSLLLSSGEAKSGQRRMPAMLRVEMADASGGAFGSGVERLPHLPTADRQRKDEDALRKDCKLSRAPAPPHPTGKASRAHMAQALRDGYVRSTRRRLCDSVDAAF
ncbi:hypothetical protein L1887_54957 [Cichorium endivia]|nr:hypothetical protein L1887_54957 [Cichorium endivia]